MQRNIFITFEGGEGAGKTSVLKAIGERLKEKRIEALLTREPGGIEIAEKIRAVILDPAHTEMNERTEALLYAAARRQHLVEKIIPALNKGNIVLCDRFLDSSLAYQGYARGLGIDEVLGINKFAIDEYMPDVSILFDIDPKEGLKRINLNSDREVNRLDLEKIEFHEKVRKGYNMVYSQNKDRIEKIDASKNKEDVLNVIKDIINKRLERKLV